MRIGSLIDVRRSRPRIGMLQGGSPSLESQAASIFSGFSGPKLWIDPSDTSGVFQDAGVTKVTTSGQSVAFVSDKTGGAKNATQTTAASMPTWQSGCLLFDGSNDFLVTPAINFSTTDKVTIVVGIRKESDAARAVILELSDSVANAGSFGIEGPTSAAANYRVAATGTTAATNVAFTYTSPTSNVITAALDLSQTGSASEIVIRINGVTPSSTPAGDAGGGSFGNYALNIGRRGGASLPFNGRIYGIMIIGRLLSVDERGVFEQFMASKTGISF